MLRPCLVALVIACLSLPATAQAWTSAKVRDVRAEVVLDARGHARVTLDIGVEVLGGWLERFDLEGLDEELTLPEGEVAWLTTDEGVVIPARAEAEGAALTLRFDKHQAARRGLHRIGVRYDAPLATHAKPSDSSRMQLAWVLPGWEHGLSRAEIVVRGPRQLAAVRDPEQAVQLTQSLVNGQSVMTFVRVLVPRSTAWAVEVEGPASLFASDAGAARPHGPGASLRALPIGTAAGLAAWVWLVGFLSRAAFRRQATRLGALATAAIRSDLARRGLSVLFAACAVAAATRSVPVMLAALLALACCFVDRVQVMPRSLPLGRFAPLGKKQRQSAAARLLRQRIGVVPVADFATLLGGLSALALFAVAVMCAPENLTLSLGSMCALPLWAASSRWRLPRSTEEQLALLVRAAEHALALSCGMRLVGFVVGDGQVVTPRIRIVLGTRFSGLVRLDVAVDTRRHAPPLVLISVTQADSPADRALAAALGVQRRELSPRGNRAAYIEPVAELGAALERQLSALAAYEQRTIELSDAQRAA